jgi:predicted nucleic acid-binding protein
MPVSCGRRRGNARHRRNPVILVDTDIMIDLLRGVPEAAAWLSGLPVDEEIGLPGYVFLELQQGCRSKVEMEAMMKAIDGFQRFWPSDADRERAITTFAKVRLSHGIGIPDLLIGECAIGMGRPIYTRNGRHFTGIPGCAVSIPYSV